MDEKLFWQILDDLDWNYEGEDDLVIKPVINRLAQMTDEEIFGFEETMASLLYGLDGKYWAKQAFGDTEYFPVDAFLYCRCVAIINGEDTYYAIKNREIPLKGDLEFEAILYVAAEAWAQKHKLNPSESPYISECSYEIGSNLELWK